ncbi:lanthionine synthetase LanC family protein [Phocaeicola barnesiae]|uniref:lanthionine synthetase LanC family protein n=1 Tax=Phocaeicola barnesiae TaxID=376804 RepID=UPI00242A5DB6|nr:lanthionine synthetase LanC family protein [Phocaeicola barnesiae]
MEYYNSNNHEMNIIHHLIIKSPFTSKLGLIHGKMGIALMFFLFSRKKNDNVYYDFACELLDEIWNEINVNIGIGFSDGLSGIGWCIEYLIQHDFVEGSSNEICKEIDFIITRTLFSEDMSLYSESELIGIWYYMSARLYSCLYYNKEFQFKDDFINKVHSLIFDKVSMNEWGVKTDILLLKKMMNHLLINYKDSYLNKPLGLNGLAGYIVNSI